MHAAQNSIDSRHDVAAQGDEELLATLRELLSKERTLSARWLVHLAEVDARGLYREHAYGSMFDYCVQALHLSEAEAYLRIRAARLGRQFPRVLRMMATGELHLSAIKLLAPVLTDANAEQLLGQARFKSKRELELLLAQQFEKPDVSSLIVATTEPTRPGTSSRSGRAPVCCGHACSECFEHVVRCRRPCRSAEPCAAARVASNGAPHAQPARPKALQGAAHRQSTVARQAQAGPGPDAARGPRR